MRELFITVKAPPLYMLYKYMQLATDSSKDWVLEINCKIMYFFSFLKSFTLPNPIYISICTVNGWYSLYVLSTRSNAVTLVYYLAQQKL